MPPDDALPPALTTVSKQELREAYEAATHLAMGLTRGNKVQAARTLGIAPSTLYEKLKKYGL